MRLTFITLLLAMPLLSACIGGTPVVNPVTTGAAVAVGAYDSMNKREQWQKYAEKGDVYAQLELAKSYHKNKLEGALDSRQALRWYCEAAKNGDAKAQYIMGQAHEGIMAFPGVTIPKNEIYAYMWYAQAARRANKEAENRMQMLEVLLDEPQRREAVRTIPSADKVDCKGWLRVPAKSQ